MKKMWILTILAAIVLVSVGLTGCSKEDKAPDQKTVEPTKEQVDAADNPATAKPKDHPAH